MNRCLHVFAPLARVVSPALLASAAVLATPTAHAQDDRIRPFPDNALRGTLVVTAPPQVTLNGRADQLSPGARIRDEQNLLVLSGSLIGQRLTVNYQREGSGMIQQVWILTPAEAREKRPTAAAAQRP